jgi:hypothetical protein
LTKMIENEKTIIWVKNANRTARSYAIFKLRNIVWIWKHVEEKERITCQEDLRRRECEKNSQRNIR